MEHENNPDHQEVCALYTTCFILECYTSISCKSPMKKAIYMTPSNEEITLLPESMQLFVDLHFVPNENEPLILSENENKVFTSQYCSRPLTLLFAMEKLVDCK